MESAILALEDGTVFKGRSFGAPAERSGEVVFNTALTGYQEIFTDPSYSGQIVILTNPQIGNYGTSIDDNESIKPYIEGLVVREFSSLTSNWRSDDDAWHFLAKNQIPVVSELDTRALVRHLRTKGVMRGVLSATESSADALVRKAREIPSMTGLDLASRVTTAERYEWTRSVEACSPSEVVSAAQPTNASRGRLRLRASSATSSGVWRTPGAASPSFRLSPPPKTCSRSSRTACSSPTARAIPSRSKPRSRTFAKLLGRTPILFWHLPRPPAHGPRLRRQGLYKLKFGHRGANHPVLNQVTNKVEITSHNHGFAVDPDSLKASDVELTHVNLNDQTLEGFRHRNYPAYCVQYHPEAAPGPHDSLLPLLSDDFVKPMRDEHKPEAANQRSGTANARAATTIHRILIVGSGPIIIGQACEFDYSGTQATKAAGKSRRLRSHPGQLQPRDHHDRSRARRPCTFMSSAPLSREYVEEIIRIERPDALLSTGSAATDRLQSLRRTGRKRRARQVRRRAHRPLQDRRRHQKG